jgi:5-methylcytosine-specific restriction endonuclease McrA
MPMDRSRYPKNWTSIALAIKTQAHWQCQECGLDCTPTPIADRSLKARKTLTVHHQDYNPGNNHPDNLIALCSACHLKKHSGRKGNINIGQLALFTYGSD